MAPTPQQNDQTTLIHPPKIAQGLVTMRSNDQNTLFRPPNITQSTRQNDQNTFAKPLKMTHDHTLIARAPGENDQNTLVKPPEKNNQNTINMPPETIQESRARAHTPQHNDRNTLFRPPNVTGIPFLGHQNDQNTLVDVIPVQNDQNTLVDVIPLQNDQNTLVEVILAQNDRNTLVGRPDGPVVVAMVPFPAQGHLNQLLHLSRLLLRHHNLPVHYLSSATHNRQAALRVHGWDPSAAAIRFHDLPLPPFPAPPPSAAAAATKFPSHLQPLFDSLHHLRRPLSAALRRLAAASRRVVVIHDSMMTSLLHHATATSPNIETYNFHSVSSFAIRLYLSDLAGEPPAVAGAPPLEGCFSGEFAGYIARQYALPAAHAGSVFNTCRAVEGEHVAAVEAAARRRSWAVGPLNPVAVAAGKERHVALEWLDGKEVDSVIYVSFGTTTTMEEVQVEELALGLERSQQNFIWVLRAADKGDVFLGADNNNKYNPRLPQGYEERVKGRGLIVRDWAPQLEILAHPSTGGFMSHCGWNSAMEALTMGVPVAAWPMHSDQPRNTCLLARVLRVALPVVADWSRRRETVPAAAVEGVVRRLMAGGEVRRRAAELGGEVRRAAEKGGASRLELEAFVAHLTR